jgi:hypothetical protein
MQPSQAKLVTIMQISRWKGPALSSNSAQLRIKDPNVQDKTDYHIETLLTAAHYIKRHHRLSCNTPGNIKNYTAEK